MTATILTWLLGAFFLIGGGVNIVAPAPIRAEFQRWGFPHWFHLLVGGLELAAAIMLFVPGWRTSGFVLAAATMAAATTIVLYHKEYGHALIPCALLAVTCIAAWI